MEELIMSDFAIYGILLFSAKLRTVITLALANGY